MAETPGDGRVAVYLDFDNIVMSWYDRVHGRNAFHRDRSRIATTPHDPEIARRLQAATIDVGAVIDYASSFGTLVLTRAYADWSAPVNVDYSRQLVARAVELVQLFPAAAYAKNGADIRLAVDTVEDMFRLPDLTHVVIVAGDSDYVPLAQRCRRLGRSIIGVGVAGSTAKSLSAACDEFESYDSLPGVAGPGELAETPRPVTEPIHLPVTTDAAASDETTFAEPADEDAEDVQDAATRVLERALRISQRKGDDAGWLHSSAVKQHIKRMDPSFSEKVLGYRSFSDFLKSREDLVDLEETGHERLVRLKA